MLTKRRIVQTRSVVGPKYDPYLREAWTLCEEHSDGKTKSITWTRCALVGDRLEVDDQVVIDYTGYPPRPGSPDVADEFAQLTGLSHRAFWRVQQRYFEAEDEIAQYDRMFGYGGGE